MATPKRQLRYLKNSTHRISIDYPIAEYNKLKALADEEGVPLNTFLRKAIKTYISEHKG